MAEEIKKPEETKEANQADVSAADELAAVTTQLDEEKKAKNEALANVKELTEALEKKDFTIADLETKRGELEQSSQSLAAEVATTTKDRDVAVAQYLSMAKALNPSVPEGIIAGATIEEINESINKGKAIVEAVKKTMEAEAAGTKVPAGAPERSAISTESMSPREKIAAGIQPKGGTS